MSNLTDQQIARIKYNADMATLCLNVVTFHVTTKAGEHFTVEALPWRWLEAAASLSRLSDVVKIFATHTGWAPEDWWYWRRPCGAQSLDVHGVCKRHYGHDGRHEDGNLTWGRSRAWKPSLEVSG